MLLNFAGMNRTVEKLSPHPAVLIGLSIVEGFQSGATSAEIFCQLIAF